MTEKVNSMPSYPQVLATIEDGELRTHVLDRFKALGGNRDRWSREDRVQMAEALTYGEDWWEMNRPRQSRQNIQAVRRKLEAEIR